MGLKGQKERTAELELVMASGKGAALERNGWERIRTGKEKPS